MLPIGKETGKLLAGMLGSVISGINLNAQRIGAAADNISNSSTAGYKPSVVKSTNLVTKQTTVNSYSAGGVQGISSRLVDIQGLIGASGSSTDMAISGNGFFVVKSSASGGETLYTRDGSFKPDNQGYLVNSSGHYLQVTSPKTGSIGSVNVNSSVATAAPTTSAAISANIPAGANNGDTFTVDVRAYDSLGGAINIPVQFTKKSTSVYTLTVGNVTDNSAGATAGTALEGTSSGPAYSVDVFFGSSGKIDGYDTNSDGVIDSQRPPGIYLPFNLRQSEDLNINLDLSSTTAFAGDFTINSVQSDGASYGSFSGVSVSSDGSVNASFDNGETRSIGKIPVATFTNPNGLEALSGNVFRATDASGNVNLQNAGQGGAGTVQGGAFEFSGTDIGTEFVNMILAQNAYSASLKALGAADDMSKELVNSLA